MWFWYALLASVLWGLDYSLTEKVLTYINFTTLVAIELFCGLIAMIILALHFDTFKSDFHTLANSRQALTLVIVIALSFVIANTLIVVAISHSNATWAGFIEISYPLFIVLFSWLIWGHTHLTLGTALGAGFVLLGVGLLYIYGH